MARLFPQGGLPLSWFWNGQVCLAVLEEDPAWFLFGHILGNRQQTVTQPPWSPFPSQARLPQVSSCSMSGPTRRQPAPVSVFLGGEGQRVSPLPSCPQSLASLGHLPASRCWSSRGHRASVSSPRIRTPGSLVSEATSCQPPLVPRGGHEKGAPASSLADAAQFLALAPPSFFFLLPNSQACSVFS